jgi:hypothetical protein
MAIRERATRSLKSTAWGLAQITIALALRESGAGELRRDGPLSSHVTLTQAR